jgi:predicted dehydrogenase
MSRTWNWAVLGCGKIAGKFAADLKTLPNATLYAAASRSLDTARAFAAQAGFQKLLDIVASGELGTLKMVRADFAFRAPNDPAKRLFNVELGGGSLLDIGIYPVFAALMTLGKPDTIKTLASFCITGAEESIVMSFGYPGGRMASLASSIAADSPTQAEFWFEGGYARLNKQFNNASSLTTGKAKAEETTMTFPRGTGTGYELEAAHVMECLDAGRKESPLLPLSFSADLMEVLDRVREDAGIVIPGHDTA